MAVWVAIAAIAALSALVVLVLSPEHTYRAWKIRHLPGPPGHPLLGMLLEMARSGSSPTIRNYVKTYGSIFRVRLGREPLIVLADADLIRTVGNKATNRSPMYHILRGLHKEMLETDLLNARDDQWRMLRKAWQPAFSSESLAGYLHLMDQSALKLCALLKKRCVQGPDGVGQRTDIHLELGRMTLQVVGTCAYGVDFHALEDDAEERRPAQDRQPEVGDSKQGCGDACASPSSAAPGRVLTEACRTVVETSSVSRGSRWATLCLLLPALTPLFSRLAYVFPDRPFRRQIQGRDVIVQVTRQLISNWSVKPTAAVQRNAGSTGQGSAAVSSSALGANTKGVLPGSFLGHMLAARDSHTGEAISDTLIMAQAQIFLLAGFETTANALAFTIYLLSSHPRVQERLLAEIDGLVDALGGPGAQLSQEALDKCEYMTAVINESLRLFPPAHVTTRTSKEDLTLAGKHVPAGARFTLSIYTAQRDEARWPEPDTFRPERFLTGEAQMNAHIPFGVGSRMCIGFKFAILEIKVTLVRLFSRLTFDLEPGQEPLPMAYGITMSPKHGIWVRHGC